MGKAENMCDCDVLHQEIVKKVKPEMPNTNVIADISVFFKVFGDSTRIQILWALSKSEMCVCDIAALLGMTVSAISHQLRVLKSARLVRYRREGKTMFYALADDHVRTILGQGMDHIME